MQVAERWENSSYLRTEYTGSTSSSSEGKRRGGETPAWLALATGTKAKEGRGLTSAAVILCAKEWMRRFLELTKDCLLPYRRGATGSAR